MCIDKKKEKPKGKLTTNSSPKGFILILASNGDASARKSNTKMARKYVARSKTAKATPAKSPKATVNKNEPEPEESKEEEEEEVSPGDSINNNNDEVMENGSSSTHDDKNLKEHESSQVDIAESVSLDEDEVPFDKKGKLYGTISKLTKSPVQSANTTPSKVETKKDDESSSTTASTPANSNLSSSTPLTSSTGRSQRTRKPPKRWEDADVEVDFTGQSAFRYDETRRQSKAAIKESRASAKASTKPEKSAIVPNIQTPTTSGKKRQSVSKTPSSSQKVK